jgi:hypothetical protein
MIEKWTPEERSAAESYAWGCQTGGKRPVTLLEVELACQRNRALAALKVIVAHEDAAALELKRDLDMPDIELPWMKQAIAAIAACTGDSGHAASTGYSGHAVSTGNSGHAASTGNSGHAASTGYSGHAASTGDSGHAASTGYSGHASAMGKGSIAAAIGIEGMAKAAKGNWIVLAEYTEDRTIRWVKTEKIDGKTLKADTFYMLKKGKFVEVAQ